MCFKASYCLPLLKIIRVAEDVPRSDFEEQISIIEGPQALLVEQQLKQVTQADDQIKAIVEAHLSCTLMIALQPVEEDIGRRFMSNLYSGIQSESLAC